MRVFFSIFHMKAQYFRYILNFKQPGGTSRGILHNKETYILEISNGNKKGVGECALFRGLSSDDKPEYEQQLKWVCENINENFDVLKNELRTYPSIWIGVEQALLNLEHGKDLYFPSDFTKKKAPIKINGLIWMGDIAFMKQQIEKKLKQQYQCIKLKIGVDWDNEFKILKDLRGSFPSSDLELRVDANGAFTPKKAVDVLQQLAELNVHSIEQPIKAGCRREMAKLCQISPTPIALDEELIGIHKMKDKTLLLEDIMPQYIILKPSLIGGFSGSDEWITIADQLNIGWWITSALESNIGLNAIAQYTFTKNTAIPQGLGTGALFTNNFESRLQLIGDQLFKK